MNKIYVITNDQGFALIKTFDGYYRFVNHNEYLLTTGFGSAEAMMRNKDDIRFDPKTLIIMKNRYLKFFCQN